MGPPVTGEQRVDIGEILAVGRRWWWAIVLATVLAGSVGYAVASGTPVTYQARTRMLVGPLNADIEQLRAGDLLVRTYAELLTSQELLERTIAELELPVATDDLADAIDATADGPTRMLILRVEDADPERAVAIANTLTAELTALAAPSPQPPTTAELVPASGGIKVIDTATAARPLARQVGLITLLAVITGAVSAFSLLLLASRLKTTLREDGELIELAGLEPLGSVSGERIRGTTGLVTHTAPASGRASDYRLLATKLELVSRTQPIRSLLVLGVADTAGTGELAANVAYVMADRETPVGLVDANHVQPEVTRLLGLGGARGLTDQPAEANDLPLQTLAFLTPSLAVMPSGVSPWERQIDTVAPDRLIDKLTDISRLVIVNAPPIDVAPDALAWASAVDATLLVVHRDRTEAEQLRHVVKSLKLVGATVVGAVFEEARKGPRTPATTTANGVTPTATPGGQPAPAASFVAHRSP